MHLARKAGRITFGADACERSILSGTARMLILTEDISPPTAAKMILFAKNRSIKMIRFGTKQLFGTSFGIKDTGIVTIDDENFARGLDKLLDRVED